MRKCAVDIDPLTYSCVWLAAQLFIPEFSLTHKDQCHGTHGIKLVIQKEPELFNGLFIEQVSFVQYTYNFLFSERPRMISISR